ncbi:MAG: alpha/beta fold hydrolase [Microcystaceae cyanobacterium]
MVINFPEINQLTELTSINLVKSIQYQSILTPLSVEAITTAYAHQGIGETPILLIHGFDSSLLEFRRLLPLLSQQRETYAMDLFGLGFTQRMTDLVVSPDTIKTHLYYTWKTLIQKPIILLGASMGGATAIDFTLTYPKAVEKLILIDSAGLEKPPTLGKFMFPPLDYLATAFLRNAKVRQKISESAYYDKSFASRDAQLCAGLHLNCQGWREALISFTKSGGYGAFEQSLKDLQQSTLILWGKQDKILGTKSANKFCQIIPNHQLIWVDNCGHVPHLEQAQVVAEAIFSFI